MAVTLLFFREDDEVPALDWLLQQSAAAQRVCGAALVMLQERGAEARRPLAENLGDGLYELRAHVGRVQYRFIYCFFGRNAVVLTHGFTKEARVPPQEIRRAHNMRRQFEADPENHHAAM